MKSGITKSEKVVYLDHAATTYLAPEVKQAMDLYWEIQYGNPSSLYRLGREAEKAVRDARGKVSALLNANPSEIVFTAGGTESINLAILGVAGTYDPAARKWHIITTAIEHSAVLNSCEFLASKGFEVTRIAVDKAGFVNLNDIRASIRPETILISVMYANNEIGTVEPIREIAEFLKERNKERATQNLPLILFHTDACQAGGFLEMDVKMLGVDLMTINGSKMYGPKQIGVLYFKSGVTLKPLLYGGGQERNLRSGTENVPGIVGFAKALELAQEHRADENKRLQDLREDLINRILTEIPDSRLNGPRENLKPGDEMKRLPNNINVSFKGIDGEALLLYLDQHRICVSTGSACSSKNTEPSHVLKAIGCPDDYINGSIRITLGKRNTKEELDYTMEILKKGVEQLRQASVIISSLKKIKGTSAGSCIEMK